MQAKARYLHKHPSQVEHFYNENYTWEQDDLYQRPVSFELAMFAAEKHFFDPYVEAALDHYSDFHVPLFLKAGQTCMSSCDPALGGCELCAPFTELTYIVGHDEFEDWMVEVCSEMGVCPGCGCDHSDEEF